MNDPEIRAAFKEKVLAGGYPGSLMVDELGLLFGNCRADIAIIWHHLTGFEIKSDEDTLNRLPAQVEAYSAIFDYASLVVTDRHAEKALEIIPHHWGMTICREFADTIVFDIKRSAQKNKNIDPVAVAQLLWKDELISFLTADGCTKKMLRTGRKELCKILAERFSVECVGDIVRHYLLQRKSWRAN